jgi:hypothetical protein
MNNETLLQLLRQVLLSLEVEKAKNESKAVNDSLVIKGLNITVEELKKSQNGTELLIKAHNDLYERVEALEENS